MSTLKTINIIHPSGSTNNIVNDASGNITVGGTLAATNLKQKTATNAYNNYYTDGGTTTNSGFTGVFNSSGTRIAYLGFWDSNNIVNMTEAAYGITFGTNSSERMRIDSSGNVGIGTSSPSAKLQVQGSQASGTANVLYLDNSSATGTTLASVSFSNAGTVKASIAACVAGDGYMTFSNNNNTEKMRLDASGNLCVNTTSATGKANIYAGSAGQIALYLNNANASSSANPVLYCVKFDNTNTTSQVYAQFAYNAGAAGGGQINGNGANQAAFGGFSDIRLKENVVNLPPQLDKICSLRPVEFDFKDGSGHQIGFIAQEMQEVYPDVVGEGADEMLTITGWSKTEARLVAAIQELKAQNDELKARVAALEAK